MFYEDIFKIAPYASFCLSPFHATGLSISPEHFKKPDVITELRKKPVTCNGGGFKANFGLTRLRETHSGFCC